MQIGTKSLFLEWPYMAYRGGFCHIAGPKYGTDASNSTQWMYPQRFAADRPQELACLVQVCSVWSRKWFQVGIVQNSSEKKEFGREIQIQAVSTRFHRSSSGRMRNGESHHTRLSALYSRYETGWARSLLHIRGGFAKQLAHFPSARPTSRNKT
jgi:hypothetical protein